jgi:DNA-binding response OmpR family regulator
MLHYAEGGAPMATLLIVEDDIDTNEAVCEYLQEAGHSTISAFDGDEAITLFSENKIDLVVLDIMLPTITGLAVLNSIRKTSQVPVLMLTAMEDEQTQVASFDGQADDYMTKPFSMVILGKRITALLRRSNPAEKVDAWTYGDLTVNFSGYSAHDASGELDVTAKELDLLKLLVEHQGLVLSRTQILDGVWGDNSYVLDRLVDTYIKNLRKKLHLDCIKTVKGIGYKLEVSL